MKLKNKKGGIKAYIHNFMDYAPKTKRQSSFVSDLARQVLDSPVGYAGFSERKHLAVYLSEIVFGSKKAKIKKKHNIDTQKVTEILKEALVKCHSKIKTRPTRVYIFPSFDPTVIKEVGGVGGYCPWKNTLIIYINPTKGWETELKQTLCHEFAHAVSCNYFSREELLASIIQEGTAEHFREYIIGGKKAPWTKTLSAKKAKEVFNKIRNSLNSTDYDLYRKVMFGGVGFPKWAGYSLGYLIVRRHIKRLKIKSWNNILKLKPQSILTKSGYK